MTFLRSLLGRPRAATGRLAAGAVAASCTVLLAGVPALAVTVDEVLTPQLRAQIDPAQVGGATLVTQSAYNLRVVRSGAVPGRPGNQHQDTLDLNTAGPAPQLTVQLTDEDCPAPDTCSQVQSMSATIELPASSSITPGGAAHIVFRLTDSTPGVDVQRAPGVPVNPFEGDLTITPTAPIAITAPTFDDNLSLVRASTTESDSYSAQGKFTQATSSGSGTLFGITLASADRASLALATNLEFTRPGLRLVRTPAQRRAWLPAVAGGRPTGFNGAVAQVSGFLNQGRLTTSTGRVLPGNRHRVVAAITASADGSTPPDVRLESRTCRRGADWAACTPSPAEVTLTPIGSPIPTLTADGRLELRARFGVAPASATETPAAWGAFWVSYSGSPGPVGTPSRSTSYFPRGIPGLGTARLLIASQQLTYSADTGTSAGPPRSALTVGTASLLPAVIDDPSLDTSDYLTYGYGLTAIG